MNVERETLVEIGAALISVSIFIAILIVGAGNGSAGLDQTGAYTVVGGIVAFVVVMGIVGFWLSTRE
jgi:hypothetical protein